MSDQDYDSVTEEIIYSCQQIFENIGKELELEDLNELFQEKVYIEIFKIMFPFLNVEIEKIENSQDNTGFKLQSMIDLLSTEILTMDLSHINGDKIAEGDQKHLLNYLQIILELSKLYKMRNERDSDSQNQSQHESPQEKDEKFRQGQEETDRKNMENDNGDMEDAELLDIEIDSQGNPILDPDNPQHQEIMKQIKQNLGDEIEGVDFFNKNQPFNVINNQDSSGAYSEEDPSKQIQIGTKNFEKTVKQQQKNNKTPSDKQNPRSQQEPDDEEQIYPKSNTTNMDQKKKVKKSQKSQKQVQKQKKKQIQKSITINSNQQRVIQQNKFVRPQSATTKSKKQPKQPQSIQQQQRLFEQEGMEKINEQEEDPQPLNLDDLSPEDIEKLKEIEEMIQRGEIQQDDPMIIQLIEKIQGQMQMQSQDQEIQQKIDQLNQVDMPKIIAEQHQNVRVGLDGMRKNNLPEDEPATMEIQQKQKQNYTKFLKGFLDEHRLAQARNKSQNLQKSLAEKKLRIIQNESDNLKKEYLNEQKSMYYKLRDEKINYLRKIHRIIFELEKRKIIDEKQIYKENRKQRNQDTRNVLQSIENAYKDRINILKDNLQEKRNQRNISQVAQREVISKVEKELRQEKKRQIEEVRDLWRQEKERFDMWKYQQILPIF